MGFRPHHLLLGRSSEGSPALRMCDWAQFQPAPVMHDPAVLLACMTLEGVRLPMRPADLWTLVSTSLLTPSELGCQMRVPESVAIRLLDLLQNLEGQVAGASEEVYVTAVASMLADAVGLPLDAAGMKSH